MFLDIILVTVSMVLLTMLTAGLKTPFSYNIREALLHLQRNSVIAGIVISVILLMIAVTRLESTGTADMDVTALLGKVLICLRPCLVGLLYRYIFYFVCIIFDKNNKKNITDDTKLDTSNQKEGQLDLSVLSRREIEVARLAAKGYTNAQIAETLYISSETVKRHMATIFEKLGLRSRKELILGYHDLDC